MRGDLVRICIVRRGNGYLGRDLLRIRVVRLSRRNIGGICAVSLVLCSRRWVELRLNHHRNRVDGTGDATSGFFDRSGPDTSATDGIDDGIHEDDVVVYER